MSFSSLFLSHVVQVSATAAAPRRYFEIGRALRPLAGEGVLIVGSGGAVHNVGALDWTGAGAPQAARAHPTEDRFPPLFFAGGAGGAAEPLHRSFSYGGLSVAAYGFF